MTYRRSHLEKSTDSTYTVFATVSKQLELLKLKQMNSSAILAAATSVFLIETGCFHAVNVLISVRCKSSKT